MADEDLGGQAVVEPDPASIEGGEGDPNQNNEPDPVEALAREMRWVPKEEWRGPEEEWKPAADFIRASHDISRSLSRKVSSIQDQLERVTSTSSQIMADKLAERDSYWQNIHAKAVEDGDHVAAKQAVDEMVKLKQAAPSNAQPLPAETADFMERHKSWMGKDPLATMRAEELANELAKRGVPIPDQLVQVERAIRKEFPEHFAQAGKPAPGTQTAANRNAGGSRREKGYADMPSESQALAKDYLERHGVPIEDFAKRYWQQQQERKVG